MLDNQAKLTRHGVGRYDGSQTKLAQLVVRYLDQANTPAH